jgi:4-hydroxy-2-oxoheptanedioate aldolase
VNISRIRAALRGGDVLKCLTLDFPTPSLAEFAGLLGYRVLAVDLEHGNTTWTELENLVRACELAGTELIVKAPVAPHVIERCLDAGVHGMHLTHVEDLDALRQVIDHTRPNPEGRRGVNRCRANRFGHYPGGYAALARESEPVFLMATVESLDGVQALPELLQIEAIDAVFVGAYDLSSTLGLVGEPNNPAVAELIDDRIIRPVLAAGKVVGLSASNREDHIRAVDRGARFTLASQARLFSQAVEAQLNDKEPVS